MEVLESLNIVSAAELATATTCIGAVIQFLKFKGVPKAWLPWLSLLIGAIIGVGEVINYGDSNYVGGAVAGLLIGGTASGAFDAIQGLWKTFSKNANDTIGDVVDNETMKQVIDIATKEANDALNRSIISPTVGLKDDNPEVETKDEADVKNDSIY